MPLSSPADIANLALERIGYKGRIGSLYDGSEAAKAALTVYAQTRDAVLRESMWDFARKFAAGVASGGTPPSPWTYEYTYPADCIIARNVYGASQFVDINNPIPTQWAVGDGASGAKVIWARIPSATIVYTAQVTDPTRWNALFIEALAAALGRRLVTLLASPELVKMTVEDEKASTSIAAEIEG